MGEGGDLGKQQWLRAMQQNTLHRHGMLRSRGQGLHQTAIDIGRMALKVVLVSFDGLNNRCASAPARTLKNWMVSRQGPQWKVTRGTSVFAISPAQRGQCGFMEYLESCQGDAPARRRISGPELPAGWSNPGGREPRCRRSFPSKGRTGRDHASRGTRRRDAVASETGGGA